MTPKELHALRMIEKYSKVSSTKLSRLVGVTTDYAAYLLESLEKGGYIEKLDKRTYGAVKRQRSWQS